MSRKGWIMLRIGYATLVAFTALIAVAVTDLSTAGDLSLAAAFGVAAIVVVLGAVAQFFIFQTLRDKHGRA